jgi:hypothetical protein
MTWEIADWDEDPNWHFIHCPERTYRPWLLIRETPFVYERFATLQQAIDRVHADTHQHHTEPTA